MSATGPDHPRTAAHRPTAGGFISQHGAAEEEQRPTHQELAEWLVFDPDRGHIWLDEQRMALLHHQTLGALRGELIQGLGVERARGILTRCGYMAGARDARFVASHWPKDHPVANLMAGARLFGLQGLASVETVHFEYDPARVSFNGEFFWHHSLEDDEHIAAFGVGTDAACWMPLGYANGYVSTLVGAPIVFREVTCRSTGATACRVIGKAASEWEDVEEDLRYMRAEGFVDAPPVQRPEPAGPAGLPQMVGISASFNTACHQLRQVAPTPATVLFIGESGVGKELFARMLHEVSPRRGGPFVAVNCAALPGDLVESELFGVERGAFTGATTARPGRFERASGGTLFLDEVASLSPAAQSKLLRALQEGEIERVGATRAVKLDLRVVAACNVELREEVRQGRFREDLFYRLNVYPIHLPPLRSRSEDIPLLMTHFLQHYAARYGRQLHGFTPRAMRAMLTYPFPGNVRELQNMIERAVIAAEGEPHVDTVHLFRDELFQTPATFGMGGHGPLRRTTPDDPAHDPPTRPPGSGVLDSLLALHRQLPAQPTPGNWLGRLETLAVREAVERCEGNMSAAARLLGVPRAQVVYRMRETGRQPAD